MMNASLSLDFGLLQKILLFSLVVVFGDTTLAFDTHGGGKGRALPVAKQDCSDLDLRSKLPPVRDQDSISWCYAFVAADLASFKMQRPISGASIAMNNNSTAVDRILALYVNGITGAVEGIGGHIGEALKGGVDEGFCAEEDLPSTDFEDSQFKSVIQRLEASKKILDQSSAGPLGIPIEPLRRTGLAEICRDNLNAVHRLFPGVDLTALYSILDRSVFTNLAKHLAAKSCSRRLRPSLPFKIAVVSRFAGGEQALTKNITDQLNSGNIVGIEYNAKVLLNRKWGQETGDFANHSSVVVGRRWNSRSNQCEYLLRNSWGESCSGYPFSYSCDRGNVYVPAQSLMGATSLLTFIK